MSEEYDLTGAIKYLKKNWVFIVLAIILIFGGYLRSYHMDYPVVGYHNWKDTHYLTEARNFAEDGYFTHGFFVPRWDYPGIGQDPSGAHIETLPTASIATSIVFKIFGPSLFAARFLNMIIGMITIFGAFLFYKKLFNRDDFALIGAALIAINPLNVFFTHNTQLINYSLMFTFFAGYYYLKWYDKKDYKQLIYGSIFMMFAFITKYSFFFLAIPIIATFPYLKEFKHVKKNWKYLAIIAVVVLVFSLQLLQTGNLETETDAAGIRDSLQMPTSLSSPNFWPAQKSFLADNYTILGGWFALLGLISFVIMMFLKKKITFGDKFLIAYILGFFIWFFIMANKVAGHNYHWTPTVPLFIALMAYFIWSISMIIEKIIKIKLIRWIPIIILFSLLISPSIDAKNRQYDTQFFGLDIAGNYLKENKQPGDVLIHSSHQAYGVLWHGDIVGTRYIPRTLDQFQYLEDERNAQWLFIYNWDFGVVGSNQELWSYIADNYKMVQTGFSINNNQITGIYYFLFQRGGNVNETLFQNGNLNGQVFTQMIQGLPVNNWQYERSFDNPIIQYVNLE